MRPCKSSSGVMILRQTCIDEARGCIGGNYALTPVFFVLALLICFGAANCGGGSSGVQNPPPPPAFTTIDAPGAASVRGYGTSGVSINSAGDTAGFFTDTNGVAHGFIRTSAGSIATFDAPGAGTAPFLGTMVRAINASGNASGFYSVAIDISHSYIRTSSGTLTEFDPPSSIGSDALCLNDSGAVAGGLLDFNGHHGFVRGADGTFAVIDPTGNASEVNVVIPTQINSSGAVAGYYIDTNGVDHGFLRDSSVAITILDAPGAGTSRATGTDISDINTHGVMVGGIGVGTANGVVDTTHSFMLAANGTYTFFEPPQAVSSIAEGINDNGVIVGEYRDANLVRHGYIRQTDGTLTSFDEPNASLAPTTAGNLGTAPRGINLGGEIVGIYSDAAGAWHAFVRQ